MTLELEELIKLSKNLPKPVIGRNDLCPCGSEKKYKKCCITKKQKKPTTTLSRLDMYITSDPLTPEESQCAYTPAPESEEELLSTLYHTLSDHRDQIDSPNCMYITTLEELRKKYPNTPAIRNFLLNGYKLLGMKDKELEILYEMRERFPSYLFGLTAMANHFLENNEPEKVPELFNNCYSLKQLYPSRKTFHITEFTTFQEIMIKYYCDIGELDQAEIHLGFLEPILGNDDNAMRWLREYYDFAVLKERMTLGFNKLKQLVKREKGKD